MSLLKVNEVQNYNGSSLTLTASTVSTSAQLNTGGNISVTGSINVSDDSTTRSNLGLGSIATQDSSNVTITGGNISNATLASSVTFPAGGTGNAVSIAILAEQFAYNADKGSSAGINLREINTEISDTDGIVTISGSPDYTFTITNAGLYSIEWVTFSYKAGLFYSFLTDASDTKITHAYSNSSYGVVSYNASSIINGFFIENLSSSKVYKLKSYHENAETTFGRGIAHDVSGDPNNYSIVKITKLK